ncbi:MAG: phosphatidylserine decarboxylase [Myxococcales bacterium]|nr:phosphatidylserine decarboxylase [Myxococcales bacterium]MCB9702525.1 phosphatidylserine decarboxylase [Myxococcales bacterium]
MTASKLVGAAARARLPRSVSKPAIAAYVKVFGVDLGDVDRASHDDGYDSFDAFFTRRLRRGARSIDRATEAIVAPCDGLLREVVEVRDGVTVNAKGFPLSIAELVADDALAQQFEGGMAATIYLHPRDYHRVHAPCDALAEEVILVPGRLLPVTDAALDRVPSLFTLNERMVHVLDTIHGKMAVVMVAAFGVGHMSCVYRHLAAHPTDVQRVPCAPPPRLRKGDEIGIFHLGSTVVLVTEPGVEAVKMTLPQPLRLGQTILQGRAKP